MFIGEDSGRHLNNYVWVYNVESGSLSRIPSVPAGAECVCLTPIDNANSFAYVLSRFQHPGDWGFTQTQADLDAAIKTNRGDKKQAAVRSVSGLPTVG